MKPRLLIPLLMLLGACGPAAVGPERILLVTTTTVEGSGLLDALVSAYHASQDRYRISTTATGSGAALELGRRGDADLLLTHDPRGEARFMAQGHGTEQGPVMRNQYVVVGPPEDPAKVRGETDLARALSLIAESGATFISRGDDSGTHRSELSLWDRAGRREREDRPGSHVETGSGMAETLRVADQRRAYTLTDSGTFRHLAPGLEMEILAAGDPPEINLYRYTLPERPRSPEGARDFLAWLQGPGQSVIASYGRARFAQPLFHPAATPPDSAPSTL